MYIVLSYNGAASLLQNEMIHSHTIKINIDFLKVK